MRIDVSIDTICPWCYVGKRQLDLLLDNYDSRNFEIHWHPFFINPEIPQEGLNFNPYTEKVSTRKNWGHFNKLLQKVTGSVNIEFDFSRIKRIPNTVDSHRMIRFANEADKGSEMLEAIYQNYFLLGQDIGERSVLIDIASKLGFDEDQTRKYLFSDQDIINVKEQNQRTTRLGIRTVPAFVINNQFSISGVYNPKILEKTIKIAIDFRSFEYEDSCDPKRINGDFWEENHAK